MSSGHSSTDTAQLQLKVRKAGTRKGPRPVRAPKLTNNMLLRHLAEVAALSKAEGDLRMAEHLIDVVYHLASVH